MAKILKIDRCVDCPYYFSGKANIDNAWITLTQLWQCHHPDVGNKDTAEPHRMIQDWCPLDDAPEEGEKNQCTRS